MTQDGCILLIEDNPDDIELTLRALRRNHVANSVVLAHDGQEAIDLLFGLGGHQMIQPQVVLLDLKLPRIDGLEVLGRIRGDERTKLLPVVILTSSKEEQDMVRGYSLGANSYVQKPVDFTEFIEAARQLSLYWLMLNEPPPKPVGRP